MLEAIKDSREPGESLEAQLSPITRTIYMLAIIAAHDVRMEPATRQLSFYTGLVTSPGYRSLSLGATANNDHYSDLTYNCGYDYVLTQRFCHEL